MEKGEREGYSRDPAGDTSSGRKTWERHPAGISAPPLPRSYPRRGSPGGPFPGGRTARVSQRSDPDCRQVLPRLTASSCQSCAGCSVRAACARTAWLRFPQHRPGRGTELDAATLAAVHPKAALEPEWAEAGAFYRPSGGRGVGGVVLAGPPYGWHGGRAGLRRTCLSEPVPFWEPLALAWPPTPDPGDAATLAVAYLLASQLPH